jgi:DNA-directed RNA polymerase specialized sigma subunit
MSSENLVSIMDYRHSQGLAASFEELETEEIPEMDRRRLVRAINSYLTKRQKQIINMIRRGYSETEIAKRLGLKKAEITRLKIRAIEKLKCKLFTNK